MRKKRAKKLSSREGHSLPLIETACDCLLYFSTVLPTMLIAKMSKIDRKSQVKSLTSNLMTVPNFCATLFLREIN